MRNMVKMLFRYVWKNKLSLASLVIFTSLSGTAFSSLMMLSENLQSSYDYLVDNGNLSNGVVHELYSTTVKQDDSTTSEDETTLTGIEAEQYNKTHFQEDLSKLIGKENWRRFRAIDYTGTNSGYAYKVIENDVDYTINKVVMYGGHDNIKPEYDFSKILAAADWTQTTPEAIKARQVLTFIISRANFTDSGIANDFKKAVDIIINNQNSNPKKEIDPKDDKSIPKYVRNVLKDGLDNSPDNPNYVGFRDKGYRLSFSFTIAIGGNLPVMAFNVDNPSSYSLVVPQYVLDNQNKELLPENLYQEYKENFANPTSRKTQVEFQDWIKTVPEKYKVKIDNLELLLIGNGLSPDFMYPVYDLAHATPNPKTEVISYGNSAAYELVHDANRSAFVEDYLVLKAPHMNQELIDELNNLARKYMSWPSNIPAAYMMNDTSCVLAPTGIRVSFLPQLVDLQVGLSNAICWFVGILTSIVFIFSVKKFINDNRTSLAILRANGFKKRWLVWLMPLYGLIPSAAGAIISYTIAQTTQASLVGLYSNFWFIPTAVQTFNAGMFFGLLIIPFVLMGILAAIFTYIALKKNTKELMSESSRFRVTHLSKTITVGMKKAPIMTRFKTSVAFSSVPKLLAITTLFGLAATTMSFSNSLVGKFDYIKSATYDTKKYQFALDLITPSVQGGGYIAQSFYDAGKPVVDDKNNILNYNGAAIDSNYTQVRGQAKKTPPVYNDDLTLNPDFTSSILRPETTYTGDLALNHLPSASDANWQSQQIDYLKYRLESPPFVDVLIGKVPPFNAGTNPYNIARALMPANASMQASVMYRQLWNKMANDDSIYFTKENIKQYKTLKPNSVNKIVGKPLNDILVNGFGFIKYVPNQEDASKIADDAKVFIDKDYPNGIKSGWYEIDKLSFVASPLPTKMNDEYIAIMSYISQLPQYADLFYKITYSSALLEKGDETYTKVKAKIEKDNKYLDKVEIMGIKPNTKYVDLVNADETLVNNKLELKGNLEEKFANNIHDLYKTNALSDQDNYNIIINESAAYQYGLKIGDTITLDPQEEATRFNPKSLTDNPNVIDLSSYNDKIYKFKIVDIIETYQNPEFYINQRIANYINAMHLKPIMDKSFYNVNHFDPVLGKDDISKREVYQMDPFNGIFSDKDTNKNVSVNTTLYSTSSLAPASDTIGLNLATRNLVREALQADVKSLKNADNSMLYIGKMDIARALGYVDPNTLDVTPTTMAKFEADYPKPKKNDPYTNEDKIINLLVSQYSDSPFLSSVNNIAYVNMFVQIFDNVSHFVNAILTLIIIIIFIISIVSVTILATDLIDSSIAICSILKALGVYDKTNAMSFLSMFFPAAIISLALSVPLTMLLDSWFKSLIYGFSNILLPISYTWWLFLSAGGLLALVVGITMILSIKKLKKQNLPKVISGF